MCSSNKSFLGLKRDFLNISFNQNPLKIKDSTRILKCNLPYKINPVCLSVYMLTRIVSPYCPLVRRYPQGVVSPARVTNARARELVTALRANPSDSPDGRRPHATHAPPWSRPASVTLCCAIDEPAPRTRIRRVGPRPVLVTDDTGVLPTAMPRRRRRPPSSSGMFADASPSKRSMRAGPEYRQADAPGARSRAVQALVERMAADRPSGG